MTTMKEIEFILYVGDQEKSKNFYQHVLGITPHLHVPGMTEFELAEGVKLGLMPENGIARILSDHVPHPRLGNGIPRCELYLKVENAETYLERGFRAGAKKISALQSRDWGDQVGYIADLDGHIIAFAESERPTDEIENKE